MEVTNVTRKWSRLLKIGLPVLLVAGLVAGLTTTALAAPKNNKNTPAVTSPSSKVITGKVTAINLAGSTFTVQSANQTLTVVSANASTKFYLVPRRVPGRLPAALGKFFKGNARGNEDRDDNGKHNGWGQFKLPDDINDIAKLGKAATIADLAVGDNVVVRLFAGSTIAQQVLIVKPVQPKEMTVTGNITSLSTTPGALTVTQTGTNTVFNLTWDANTRFVLKGVISLGVGQKVNVVYNPTTKVAIAVRAPVP